MIGSTGVLMRFRVVVERGVDEDPSSVAAFVEDTLADDRGWTAGGWRFQRSAVGPYDFTVYLATPTTTDRLCAPLQTDGEVSCRQGARVVLNLRRWLTGVSHYDADLDAYRRYMINHEIGHRLGHGHELCPGKGERAPVMQQQTIALRGCRGNPWPYVGGKRYHGPPGSYD